jgi:hypothetical protein
MRTSVFLLALLSGCGGLLPFFGDDEDVPPPAPASDAATDVRTADGESDGSNPATNDAAAGDADDGGSMCIGSKQCAEFAGECCSQQRGSGCTIKCEIICCL